jgi:hypothetical protein
MQITEKLATENLLLLGNDMVPSESEAIERSTNADGMTATRGVCEIMCTAFKQATLDVASDFLLRWIQNSQSVVNEKSIQHCKQLNSLEHDRVMQQRIAEFSKQQLQLELQTMSKENENRATSEIQALKSSASINLECMQTMFLETFEKMCDNAESLRIGQDTIAKERELQHTRSQGRNDKLLSFAVGSKRELSSCRLIIEQITSNVTRFRKETEEKVDVIKICVLRLIENCQREHDASMLKSASEFAESLAEKIKEVEIINKHIEEKDACIVTLSSKLASEQSDLTSARQQHDRLAAQLAELTKSHFLETQHVLELTGDMATLQNEKTTLKQSLNQEQANSARLQREATVMQENFRRLEKDNESLRLLNEEQKNNMNKLQHEISKESDAKSRLILENDQQKIEADSARLARDKLRCASS